MKLPFKELGSTLVSVAVFQIATSILSLASLIGFYNIGNNYDVEFISTSQLITDSLISLILILSLVIIGFRKKIGIYIYIFIIISSLISAFIFTGLNIVDILISLIIPVLFLVLVYKKRELF